MKKMANPIKDLVESAINSLEGMFKAESVVGNSITASDGTVIIPIAKVSFGVGGGGSEFTAVNGAGDNLFGGGVGAGASVKPQGFLVITKSGSIRFVSTESESDAVSKLVEYAPELVEKITSLFKKDKSGKEEGNEQE